MKRNREEKFAKWEIDRNRFVGFVDVMGFKEMVLKRSHEEVGDILNSMIFMKDALAKHVVSTRDIGKAGPIERDRVKSIAFSDSVVFITKNDSFECLSALCTVMSIFQEAALQRTAPTKVAISLGRFTADFDKSIFYGQPLIDAYELQDQIFYYGIIADNKVQEYLINKKRKREIDNAEINAHFNWLQTPTKKGKVFHYNLYLDSINDEQLEDLYKMVSGDQRKYVDNTIEIYHLMNRKKGG